MYKKLNTIDTDFALQMQAYSSIALDKHIANVDGVDADTLVQ